MEQTNTTDVKARIKDLIVRQLRLKVPPDSIRDDQPLFGSDLGLDSIDALELVVGLEKEFGVSLSDPKLAQQVVENVNTIAQFVSHR